MRTIVWVPQVFDEDGTPLATPNLAMRLVGNRGVSSEAIIDEFKALLRDVGSHTELLSDLVAVFGPGS